MATTGAVDMWTMRLPRTAAKPWTTMQPLPTACQLRPHTHSPSSWDKYPQHPKLQYTHFPNHRSTHCVLPLSASSRLIPALEKTSLTLQSELTDLASRLQATQFVAECRRQALNLPFGIDQIAQS